MNKKFGQNFLLSQSCIDKIVRSATSGFDAQSLVYEIGPGIGSLSSAILRAGFSLKAFEIDKGFVNILINQAFATEPFCVIEGDVMDTLFLENRCPDLLLGNLPYNISAPLLATILRNGIASSFPSRMVFLLQKEVAYKFAAKSASKEFSHLSFMINLSYIPKVLFTVSRGAFFPSPNVDSALLLLDKKSELIPDFTLRLKCIDFSSRIFKNPRKTVVNNLKDCIPDISVSNILRDLGINPLVRPAELTEEQIISIFGNIETSLR